MVSDCFISESTRRTAAASSPDEGSPARPTMGRTDHLGPQFTALVSGQDEPEEPEDAGGRRPNYVGQRTLAEYRSNP